jgi:hypothetical protein
MFDKIKHINPKELIDIPSLQKAVTVLLNAVESLWQRNEELSQENQELKDEINRLKGEQGSLPKNPGKRPKTDDEASTDTQVEAEPGSEKRKSKNHKTGSKKDKIKIDRSIKCEIDGSILPPDAKLHHYETVIQQDIRIERDNTLFIIPVFYSKSEKKTYRGILPEEYEGEFGGTLKSWLQLLHQYGDMTQSRLKALMDSLDIQISVGSINNILLSNTEMMSREAREILRSGIENIGFTQLDSTKSWECGEGKSTQIICTPYYSVYYTMDDKSKASIIWALQGKGKSGLNLVYNNRSVELLKQSRVPKKDQQLLSQLLLPEECCTLKEFEDLLAQRAPHLLTKQSYPAIIEALALGYYHSQSDFPVVQNLLSDAGPEYHGIAPHQGLCWIHEERHYKKLTPNINIHRKALEEFRGQIWGFYNRLLSFKALPTNEQQQQKIALEAEFERIFTQKTDYFELNERIDKSYAKKDKLLRVLNFPDLPLHNNTAELGVRRKVRKRDISLHTTSPKGTKAQDAFMSVVETAAKLGVPALDYLYDRITEKFQMPSLADLIMLKTN